MKEELKIGTIKVTSQALEKFQSSIDKENPSAIRIGCKGGGCSGLLFLLDFIAEEDIDEDEDNIYIVENIKFVVDIFSEVYLKGITLDYISTLKESGFKFVGGQVKRTCGCGSSFAV